MLGRNSVVLILLIITLFFNCSTKKDVLYVQDISDKELYNVSYDEYKIQLDDVLKISILSKDPETTLEFNPSASNITNSKEILLYNGYQVNQKGNINFSSIGEINVEGLTIIQAVELVRKIIIENKILIDPIVDIKLLNTHFIILGEVNRPGKYDFFKNNLNILEAIGMAGDLTINGERKKIKVLRNKISSDKSLSKKIFSIDLTSSDFINSDAFQILSGDIIIVNPNSSRIKNAGIIGNSGTLLSLLSFVLSSIIVISN